MKKSDLPKASIIALLVGFIPIVGIIFAIIYSKMFFVKPLKQYVPAGKTFLGKVLLKLILFLIIVLQIVPILGAFMAPLILIINYRVWKSFLEKELSRSA